jgi:CHAT domain-containing protein
MQTFFIADSATKVSEIGAMGHFNSELLVLSACKTNVGKVAKDV